MAEREIVGTVLEALPGALYRVRCDAGKQLTVSLSASARKTTVKVSPGDRVRVDVSPFDPTRGRIRQRLDRP